MPKEPSIARVWDHPQLGRFAHNGAAWVGSIELPAFRAFAYEAENADAARGSPFELAVEAAGDSNAPSTAAVALIGLLSSCQAELVSHVAAALWDDFNGRGLDSGMWWHNGVEAVGDAARSVGLHPPAAPHDLFAPMRLESIFVREGTAGGDAPSIELIFSAAFEPEHGVGVLVDGRTVLGIGYCGEALPFGAQG